MSWSDDKLEALPVRNGFRMRGEAMTRLEVFSDAAFAFAVTTLVVSVGSIPGSFDELIEALKKVPAFALSFAQIIAFWIAHRSWSRRYGLEDIWTTILSLVMIFTVLVYVFPLRLIFSIFMSWVTGGWLPQEYLPESTWEIQGLFGIYGIGFSVLAATLMGLSLRSLKAGEALRLNKYETMRTRESVAIWSIQVFVGLLSAVWALALPGRIGVYAGFVYFLLPVLMPLCSMRYAKKTRALMESEKEVEDESLAV